MILATLTLFLATYDLVQGKDEYFKERKTILEKRSESFQVKNLQNARQATPH